MALLKLSKEFKLSNAPKYSLYLGEDKPDGKNLIRLDDGLFSGTIFTFENIKVSEDANEEASLNYDTNFYKVSVNGVEIDLDHNENMRIDILIGDQLAKNLYEDYISKVLLDIIETQIRLEKLNG